MTAVGMLFLGVVGLIWGFGGASAGTEAAQPEPMPRFPGVRPSAFENGEEVVLRVQRAPRALPAVTSVVPERVSSGGETTVGIFGKNFSPGAKVASAGIGEIVDVVSLRVVSKDLIEATLRIPPERAGEELSLVVVDENGNRTPSFQLSVTSP